MPALLSASMPALLAGKKYCFWCIYIVGGEEMAKKVTVRFSDSEWQRITEATVGKNPTEMVRYLIELGLRKNEDNISEVVAVMAQLEGAMRSMTKDVVWIKTFLRLFLEMQPSFGQSRIREFERKLGIEE
ncbi:hypothetical protein [Thermodesulfovibrio sp. 3462-1]|uniref:CopG family transcriptional regulator n=1 Tax=Thermodesulfovibrio obliviosus TaxID=3118332 RepID=A0AAU8GZ35_9BACT